MRQSAAVLKLVQPTDKTDCNTAVSADAMAPVDMPLYSRKATVKALGKLYRITKARAKALETELDVMKTTLRTIGQSLLDTEADSGNYYTKALVGGVPVSRANKFKPVPYERDSLMEYIGMTEYKLMFNEKASIEFSSIDKLREHVMLCEVAGVEMTGKPKETISGNAKLAEHLCKTRGHLEPRVVEALEKCAVDQAARVGGR